MFPPIVGNARVKLFDVLHQKIVILCGTLCFGGCFPMLSVRTTSQSFVDFCNVQITLSVLNPNVDKNIFWHIFWHSNQFSINRQQGSQQGGEKNTMIYQDYHDFRKYHDIFDEAEHFEQCFFAQKVIKVDFGGQFFFKDNTYFLLTENSDMVS